MEWRPPVERADASGTPLVEMPLFPLGLVLFPHMPLPLHIFEARYQEMVHRCVQDQVPFGVVLITEGTAEGDPDVATRTVGCSARIAHHERLADGRLIILAVGEQRFRIVDTHENRPYRTGLIEWFRDAPADASAVVPLADEVQQLLLDFLVRSLALAGQSADDVDLPDEPEQLSFTAACVLPFDDDEKQALLENTNTGARLAREKEVLLREIARLRRVAEALEAEPEPVTTEQFAPFRCEN